MTEQPGSTCLRWLCVLARWFRWRQLENLDVARCVADRMIRARRVDRDQDVQMSRCCCNRGWQSRLRSTSSVALRGFDERRNWLNFTRASSYDGDESRCRRDEDETRREPRITNGRGHGVHFTEIWTRDPWWLRPACRAFNSRFSPCFDIYRLDLWLEYSDYIPTTPLTPAL